MDVDIDRKALLDTFLAESAENLAALEETLLSLEERPDDDDAVATLFRAAHTLKGNSDALGVQPLTATAHATEDVLSALRARRISPTSALVSLLLEAHDAMRTILEAVAADRVATVDADLVARLIASSRGSTTEDTRSGRTGSDRAGRSDAPTSSRKTLRVDLPTLDAIVTSLEELAVARGRLQVTLEKGASPREATDALLETDRQFDALRSQVMRLRLVDVGPAFRAQARTVRDLAQATGKRARLRADAAGVEVDTSVLDALRDPIMHMVRNAVDHGLEAPDVRRARGKDPVGTIVLRAHRESGRLVVEISDDGEGFHRDRILAKAKTLGLLRGDGAEMTDGDVFRLVLAPGFSTSEEVSDLSGRGVGMDVVAQAVAQLRGTLEIASREGLGTTVTLRVPLTLSIVEGFTVDVASECYVVPLDSVRECLDLSLGERAGDDGAGVLSLRGAPLPFVRLRALLGVTGAPPTREKIVVVEHDGQRAGLAVDGLGGRGQAVMKPLAEVLRVSDTLSGTTLLGDGRVALILDVPAILRTVVRRADAARLKGAA